MVPWRVPQPVEKPAVIRLLHLAQPLYTSAFGITALQFETCFGVPGDRTCGDDRAAKPVAPAFGIEPLAVRQLST